MGPLERVCVMRTKLRDNSCKNHRILLPLLHPCALQFSCALHLFALLSDHTHIHFCFCLQRTRSSGELRSPSSRYQDTDDLIKQIIYLAKSVSQNKPVFFEVTNAISEVSLFSYAKADNHNTVNRPSFAKQVSRSFVRDPFQRNQNASMRPNPKTQNNAHANLNVKC